MMKLKDFLAYDWPEKKKTRARKEQQPWQQLHEEKKINGSDNLISKQAEQQGTLRLRGSERRNLLPRIRVPIAREKLRQLAIIVKKLQKKTKMQISLKYYQQYQQDGRAGKQTVNMLESGMRKRERTHSTRTNLWCRLTNQKVPESPVARKLRHTSGKYNISELYSLCYLCSNRLEYGYEST